MTRFSRLRRGMRIVSRRFAGNIRGAANFHASFSADDGSRRSNTGQGTSPVTSWNRTCGGRLPARSFAVSSGIELTAPAYVASGPNAL